MRIPENKDPNAVTIAKLDNMKGHPLTVKVNRGRNKIELCEGVIESTYPNVFTVRKTDGNLSTFTYADITAGNILFYRRKVNES